MDQYLGNSHQKFGHTSYSQHGEDLYFMNLWKFLKIDKLRYLDLGAHHPIHISNTHLLYLNGARGVNVEANSFLISEFGREHPQDINLSVGVGPECGHFEFYMEHDFSVLNSFKESSFEQHGIKPIGSLSIPVWHINEIVKTYCEGIFPDFLFTDLEGLDYEVLESADFSFTKPKVICSEIRQDQSLQTKQMLNQKGFTYICKFSENHIFIDNEYVEMCV
jgi:hypothetical protein